MINNIINCEIIFDFAATEQNFGRFFLLQVKVDL